MDEEDYTPTEVIGWVRVWLTDPNRERSKFTDIALVVLTLLTAVAAFWSAFIFQGQLVEARRATNLAVESFRVDERAWVEIEPIKPMLLAPEDAKFGATFTCDIFPKNVGKTVARDITVNAHDFLAGDGFDTIAGTVLATQDNVLLGKEKEMRTGKPVILPRNPVTSVLAPNVMSPVPFRLTCQAPKNGSVHYLIGRIDYCDQFQIRHWLRFCFHVVNARGEIWACQNGNDEDRNDETPMPGTSCGNPN